MADKPERVLTISRMVRCFRLAADDPKLPSLLGAHLDAIERSAYYGFVELREQGISIVFKEAPWVLPVRDVKDEKALYAVAFHLHAEGHEGYQRYCGLLPGYIEFGDALEKVRSSMGMPDAEGGGDYSELFHKRVENWIRYNRGEYFERYQFDEEDRLEMVTLFVANTDESGP